MKHKKNLDWNVLISKIIKLLKEKNIKMIDKNKIKSHKDFTFNVIVLYNNSFIIELICNCRSFLKNKGVLKL